MLDIFKGQELPTVATFKITPELLEYFYGDFEIIRGLKNCSNAISDTCIKTLIYRYTTDCGYADVHSLVGNDLDLHIIKNHANEIKEYLLNKYGETVNELKNESKKTLKGAINEKAQEITDNTTNGSGTATMTNLSTGEVTKFEVGDSLLKSGIAPGGIGASKGKKTKKKKKKVKKVTELSSTAKIVRMRERNKKRAKADEEYLKLLAQNEKAYKEIRESINTFTNANIIDQRAQLVDNVIPATEKLEDSDNKTTLLGHFADQLEMLDAVIDMSYIEDMDVVDLTDDEGKITTDNLQVEIMKFRDAVEKSEEDFIDPLNVFNKDLARIDFARVPLYVAKLFRYFNSLVVDGVVKKNVSYQVNKMVFKVMRASEDVLASIKKVEGIVEDKEDK